MDAEVALIYSATDSMEFFNSSEINTQSIVVKETDKWTDA